MYVCMYVCTYVCIYVCMIVCMYVCLHVCMHVGMYVCIPCFPLVASPAARFMYRLSCRPHGLETKRMAGPSSANPTSLDSYGGPTNWNDARAHTGWPYTRPENIGQATTIGISHRFLGLLGLLRRCRRRRSRLLHGLHGLHGLGCLHRLHRLGHGCERRVVSKICEVGKA